MIGGKKSVARKAVYNAIDKLEKEIKRPGIELFDEAMELALIGNDDTRLEAIAYRLLQAEDEIKENNHEEDSSVRILLDGLTPVAQGEGKNKAISQASRSDA